MVQVECICFKLSIKHPMRQLIHQTLTIFTITSLTHTRYDSRSSNLKQSLSKHEPSCLLKTPCSNSPILRLTSLFPFLFASFIHLFFFAKQQKTQHISSNKQQRGEREELKKKLTERNSTVTTILARMSHTPSGRPVQRETKTHT